MGLIILPIMILWFIATLYSLRMGYQLIQSQSFITFGLPIIVIALFCVSAYVYLGLASFKGHKEVWAFEIPFFFMTGKLALGGFLVAAAINIFWGDKIHNHFVLAGMFIILFTFSAGALVGSFSSEGFLNKHNISVTH